MQETPCIYPPSVPNLENDVSNKESYFCTFITNTSANSHTYDSEIHTAAKQTARKKKNVEKTI